MHLYVQHVFVAFIAAYLNILEQILPNSKSCQLEFDTQLIHVNLLFSLLCECLLALRLFLPCRNAAYAFTSMSMEQSCVHFPATTISTINALPNGFVSTQPVLFASSTFSEAICWSEQSQRILIQDTSIYFRRITKRWRNECPHFLASLPANVQ